MGQVIFAHIQVYICARLSIDQLSTGLETEAKKKIERERARERKSIIRGIDRLTTTLLTDRVFIRY